jgi:hypothetical protein
MSRPISLFLFAHQDDEFGVFPQLVREQENGRRVVCAYFTTGVQHGENPVPRNQESISVLTDLGVTCDDIHFVGERLSIADGQLSACLQAASEWIEETWGSSIQGLASIHVMAWEGGHPDHDSLHAIAVDVFSALGLVHLVRQFPLYNNYRCPGSFFRLLSPLEGNGSVTRTIIPWSIRPRFLGYCLSYSSQRKSWLGLFPFVLFHYLFRGFQETQLVSVERTRVRPHIGPLYYEKRRFSTWWELSSRITIWRSQRTLKKRLPPQSIQINREK